MQIQSRLTEEERTNLVAFLDGEVEESVAQSLEEKLSRSVSVRKELEALERTWSLLDWLPRLDAPPDFASQTVTRIHSQQLRAELIQNRLKWATVLAAKALAWVACVAAASALGFGALRHAWPDPSRELIEHLDIAENLETYRAIPDIKFLNDLNRLGLFSDPLLPATEGAADPQSGQTPDAQAPSGKPADDLAPM